LRCAGANFSRLNISNSKFDKCVLDGSDFTECTAGAAGGALLLPLFRNVTSLPSHWQFPAASFKLIWQTARLTMPI
jgi:hypothetical protein